MVILIGGSSHVGKTMVAQALLEQLHYPYVSLDHLKMAFIRTGRTELTVEDDYEMRFFLWPFAAEMIKTAVENEQNLIVEGCYIPDSWQSSFSELYLKQIRCVFLVMSEYYLRNHFSEVVEYADVLEKRSDDRPDLERLIQCSREFKEECITAKIPYIEIDHAFDPQKLVATVLHTLGLS